MTNCRVCHVEGPEEHATLVANGILHHEFSSDGDLNPVSTVPSAKQKPRNEVLVVPGIDLPLRTLLIQKGILSESDFEVAGAIPGFATSNRAPSSQPSAEGSLRPSPEHPHS